MYTFTIRFLDKVGDIDMPYVSATLTDPHGDSIANRAWIDKPYPKSKEEVIERIHEVVDTLFPNKSAPEIKETKSTVKTPRGRRND